MAVPSVIEDYPVHAEFDAPREVARWRPFFAWLVAIPHLIVLSVLGSVTGALVLIAWLAILFTGRMPTGIFHVLVLYLRYQWRTTTYAIGLYEDYPPFEFELTSEDMAVCPAQLDVEEPATLSRGLIWVKWLLAFPHYLVLVFVYIGAWYAWTVGAFAVLVTGRWPEGIRDFLLGTGRWTNRVYAYTYLLTDEYPPFSLR